MAAHPDALPVGDAGRDLDVEAALDLHLAAPRQRLHRLLWHAPVAVAAVADDGAHHLPEQRLADALQLPGAAAALARLDRRARLGAVAVAVLAAVDGLVGDLDRGAAGRLEQIDLDGDRDVGALRGGEARAAEAAAEERVEEVADRAEALEVRRVAAGAQAVVAVAVVGRAALGVGEDLVGLGRLLELLLGRGVVGVDVRVQLARERAERLLDVLLGGLALDAEHLVGVAGHRSV